MIEINSNSDEESKPILNKSKDGLKAVNGLSVSSLPQIEGFDYEKYLTALNDHLKPENIVEETVMTRVAINFLNTLKADELEKELVEYSNKIQSGWRTMINLQMQDMVVFGATNFDEQLELIDRHSTNAENRYFKSLKEYYDLKTRR